MSNESLLIADDSPDPALCGTRNPDAELVVSGPMAVPVLWLALFDESHLMICTVEAEDEDESTLEIPTLVAEREAARSLLLARRDLVLDGFPEFQPTWDQFSRMIESLTSQYLKVELEEMWDIYAAVDEDFTAQLRSSLRWFVSRDDADFTNLLAIASIQGYDPDRRTFDREAGGVPRAFHLRGYAYDDQIWDDKADL